MRRGWILAFVPSCTALFDGELGVVHCKDWDAYGPPACPETMSCFEGSCAAIGEPPGNECGADSDCRAPASCVEPAAIGSTGPKRCMLPCCSSSDCLGGALELVCVPLASGAGSFCLPASESGRARPGSFAAGEACEDGSVCRSGLCESSRCVDGCCSDAGCGQKGEVCRLSHTGLTAEPTWSCAMPPDANSGEGDCKSDNDCRTGSCSLKIGGAKYCLLPCCSSRECGSITQGNETTRLGCGVQAGVRACVVELPIFATAGVGAACTRDDACRSGLCLAEGAVSYCSDSCCDDSSCGDPRFACRPRPIDGGWALRCVRK